MALMVYEGYTLYDRPAGGYRSVIDGENIIFDTVVQWYQYINLIKRKS